MEKLKPIQLLIVAALIVGLTISCSSTKEMQVLVTRPAVFELPKSVQKILLVNRSKGNAISIIDGILTGELPGTDRIQSEQCMSGLQQTLNINKQLQITRHTERLSSDRGSSTGFGNPMNWDLVSRLAEQHNADAVLVLEFFDTDFTIRDVVGYNRLPDVFVSGTAASKAGFRLYDPKNQTIMYERTFSGSKFYTEHAPTRLLALAKLIKGMDALNEVSSSTGQNFAKRLIRYEIWEDRLMFLNKNNEEAAKGERLAASQNWQQGVDTWLSAYKNAASSEDKGKIAYNLALGYEVLGDLQEAKKWITTSYVDHQNPKAFFYSETLNKRIETEGILEKQRTR